MNIPSARTYAWLLAILRIYTGASCILRAIPKFTNGAAFQSMFVNLVGKAVTKSTGASHAFLIGTVQPHMAIFAQVVRFGELIVGLLLLLGILTRLGGLLGVIFAGSALFLQGYSLQSWSSLEATVLALCAVNLVLPTGRVLGLDALWRRGYASDETQPLPIPPSRPEAQPTVNAGNAPDTPSPTPTVATTRGEIESSTPPREPGPNGADGGPEFAAPASAGPQIDQTTSV